MNKIFQGDCLDVLKTLPDNSVDSCVTDPPYELGFMGKKWDNTGISNNPLMWKEVLRVLKPGGHLLSFSGTRTYHRMACAIEDAGFEVRDMIEWCYGSGFPKSLNIGKSVNQLETNEWSKIGKAIDNIDQKSIIEIWKSNSNNVKIVEIQSLKNQIIVGQDTLSENFVVLNVAQDSNQENSNLLVSFAEQNLNEVQAINTKINTALQSVEAEIRQLQDNVKSAEQQSQNQNHKSWGIFTAQCDVREWLKENTMVNHKVDEALKTLRGNKKYSNEEIINVLCVALTDILKLTILNRSKTFQNLDTNQKMECVSAINVIITEYIMGNLISNTVAILKSKAVDKLQGNEREDLGPRTDIHSHGANCRKNDVIYPTKEPRATKGTSEWEGWGTALKPAHEPICMARKPLAEKTVAENCLKYGTGGINIDESRVEFGDETDNRIGTDALAGGSKESIFGGYSNIKDKNIQMYKGNGRFPANLCWSCDCDNNYLTGNALFDILSNISNQIKICQLNNSNSNALSVEQKKHQQDTTSEEKKLCFAVENVDTLFLEKILGKTLEVIFSVDTECSVEMLEESMNTSLSISLSGNEKMEEYQKVLKFITLTATKLITELKTCNLSQSQIIGSFITKVISGIREQSRVKSHSSDCWVRECFPETKSGSGIKKKASGTAEGIFNINKIDGEYLKGDSGNASRFFKSIIYQAKASKSERNKGLDGYLTVKYNGVIINNNKTLCKEENMVAVQLLRKVISEQELVSFNIDESGVNIMAQCHKDSLSTILTETSRIIELKIYNLLTHSLTNESTLGVNSEMENGGSLAENVADLKRWLLTITKGKTELALGASRVVCQMLSLINEKENWKPATNFHSTVKPIALMEYLIKMVTPKGGIVLDPFAGSGSTLVAAKQNNFQYIGIELDGEYIKIAEARLK